MLTQIYLFRSTFGGDRYEGLSPCLRKRGVGVLWTGARFAVHGQRTTYACVNDDGWNYGLLTMGLSPNKLRARPPPLFTLKLFLPCALVFSFWGHRLLGCLLACPFV